MTCMFPCQCSPLTALLTNGTMWSTWYSTPDVAVNWAASVYNLRTFSASYHVGTALRFLALDSATIAATTSGCFGFTAAQYFRREIRPHSTEHVFFLLACRTTNAASQTGQVRVSLRRIFSARATAPHLAVQYCLFRSSPFFTENTVLHIGHGLTTIVTPVVLVAPPADPLHLVEHVVLYFSFPFGTRNSAPHTLHATSTTTTPFTPFGTANPPQHKTSVTNYSIMYANIAGKK